MISALMFAIGIPIASIASDRYGARVVSMAVAAMIFVFGLLFAPLFTLGVGPFPFLAIGLLLIGFTYGPLGTALAQMFPTAVRYTGSSLAFNFAGILGASLAPYIATWLATTYGLQFVGYYLVGRGVDLVRRVLLRARTPNSRTKSGDAIAASPTPATYVPHTRTASKEDDAADRVRRFFGWLPFHALDFVSMYSPTSVTFLVRL